MVLKYELRRFLTLEDVLKIIQTIFNLYPNINRFRTLILIIKLKRLGKYSWANIR